jgi:hypothetical protein
MPSQKQIESIQSYAAFARRHARERYNVNIDDVEEKWLNEGLVFHPKGGQLGLYLDNKMGSKMVKGKHGLTPDKKCVILADIKSETKDSQYFGIIFHEYGHATFDAQSRNSEHGAFCMELTALVDAVVEGLVPLDAAQSYTAERIANKMLSEDISLVNNVEWRMRYGVCRSYLQNKVRTIISYPGGSA